MPTLKGTEQLDIPAGTQHGEVFKLKGKGLPDLRSTRNGDELVQILIEIPEEADRKAEAAAPRVRRAPRTATPCRSARGFLDKLKDMFKGDE